MHEEVLMKRLVLLCIEDGRSPEQRRIRLYLAKLQRQVLELFLAQHLLAHFVAELLLEAHLEQRF